MDLNRDAMLVGLHIAAWSGRLYDRQASDHVAVAHEASTAAGRYNKRLLPKAAFAALTATMSEARAKHYANSLPWDDKGARLLTVANYEHYTELMDGFRERVVRQRARFIEDYDDYIDQARLDLGKLFRIEDYPSKEDLQGKFAIRYRITPVPDADHFIAQLASDDTERVKRDIESHIEEQLHGAVGDLYRRFGEAIERVSERLREDDEGKPLVFRDTMISNIRDLVDVVPRLNIFGDETLAQLCAQVKEKIASVEPNALRPSKTFDPAARAQVKRDADALAEKFAGYFGARTEPVREARLMAARVLGESALRVSDCVTELLRKQPFFGSLVLRLPLRPDPTRKTLATDGNEIRYSPQWVAETEAHLIETAMARVVMACALKHHTRRGERDPERWQMASQLVTHALIRDAGFTLPPDAEAWDDLSVEQAYDRLPTPENDDSGDDGDAPSGADDAGASAAAAQSSPDGDNDGAGDPSDSGNGEEPRDEHGDDDDPDEGNGDGQNEASQDQGEDAGSDAPPSHDPSGTGEVMDANARAGDDGDSGEVPLDVAAEEQAWDEAMHQALNIARAEGKVPGRVEETVKGAHASTLDWQTLLRRYMTDTAKSDYSWSVPNRRFIDSGLYLPSIRSESIAIIAFIIDVSRSLPTPTLAEFWGVLRQVATENQARARHRPPGRHDPAGRGRIRRRRASRGDRRQGPGRHRLPPGLRMARRAGHPARGVPVFHGHGVLRLPGDRTDLPGVVLRLRRQGKPLAAPRALGRAHRHRPGPGSPAMTRDPRRPGGGAPAGARSPRPTVFLDLVDRRPRSRPSPPPACQRSQHARHGDGTPQGRAPARRSRRTSR